MTAQEINTVCKICLMSKDIAEKKGNKEITYRQIHYLSVNFYLVMV